MNTIIFIGAGAVIGAAVIAGVISGIKKHKGKKN